MAYNPELRQHCFEREYRYNQLNDLREQEGLQRIVVPEEFTAGPAIGIEIEMTWWQTFPEMERWHKGTVRPNQLDTNSEQYRQFDREYNEQDTRLRPLLERVEAVIPRVGQDAYWEFSFLPTKDAAVLSAEVATLYDLHILHENVDYATHLTIAGLDDERDAGAILLACELAGGTTPERIVQPLTSQKGSWGRRYGTTGGMRRRSPHELYGDDKTGYEFRTLVTQSPSQIANVMRLAQELASLQQTAREDWLRWRHQIEDAIRNEGLPVAK